MAGKQYKFSINTFYGRVKSIQITFANNGITIISPKGYEESFTQGHMRRVGDNV